MVPSIKVCLILILLDDTSTLNAINAQPTFNPIDKLVELFEENKNLYERLLKSEQEKVDLLKQQIK